MTATLDIATVQAFLLVADLQSFTRAAEALGTTQAAVSLKLQRLETLLEKRLVERSPRAVRLTGDGAAFLDRARALMEAHDRALSGGHRPRRFCSGWAFPIMPPALNWSRCWNGCTRCPRSSASRSTIGFSREILEAYDGGRFDAVIVRREGSRRGGEKLARGRVRLVRIQALHAGGPRIPAACHPGPALRRSGACHPRARQGRHRLARALCRRRRHRRRRSGARRIWRSRRWRGGSRHQDWSTSDPRIICRSSAASNVVLHSKVSDPAKLAALRTLAATFRGLAAT